MRVGPTKAREDDLAAHFLAVLLAQEEKVGSIEQPNASVTERNTGRDVQPVGEHGDLLGTAIAIEVFENFYAIATRAGGLAGIFNALGNPDATAVVKGHRHGIDDVRFVRDQLDAET